MLKGELLDFQPSNPLAFEAAKLLMTSIYDVPEKDIQVTANDYFREAREHGYLTYGLLDPEHHLAAAGSVIHGMRLGPVKYTIVEYVAVPVERRQHGHGLTLMRYIAHNAQMQGDDVLSLYSLSSSKPFYEKLGFSEETDRPNMMYIHPAALATV